MSIPKSHIGWNLYYIKTINQCDNKKLLEFFENVVHYLPDGGFRKKRYIWNLIRGKTFYINASQYVIENIRSAYGEDHARYEKAAMVLRGSAEDRKECIRTKDIRSEYRKEVPLLSMETLPYLDADRVLMILRGENQYNGIFADDTLRPIVDEICRLKEDNVYLMKLMEEMSP